MSSQPSTSGHQQTTPKQAKKSTNKIQERQTAFTEGFRPIKDKQPAGQSEEIVAPIRSPTPTSQPSDSPEIDLTRGPTPTSSSMPPVMALLTQLINSN